jgi:hypothetical protein
LESLNKLNKVIESININITDDNTNNLKNQLSELVPLYKTNHAATYLIKMLQSLAKHLGSKKNKVNADTLPVLNSIASGLEQLMDNPDLTKDEINEILLKEVLQFKSLKNKISSTPLINDNEINELKAVLLAIDWEISDTTLENFKKVITNLLSRLKYYNIHFAFLKIINTTVQYIGTQKANAHTDSISFLHSVFESFEQIVQTPEMTYKEKKQLLETDIKKFQAFKNKISSKEKEDQIIDNTSDDESFAPALSQFRETSISANDDDTSLTTLSEIDDTNLPIEAVTDTDEPSTTNSENIMDDLFNTKESPADELLDAIHLLNVHGDNPDQAMDMPDKTEELQTEGIKNITPQTKSNDPIPEISNRLDEFFNLDIPGDDMVQSGSQKDQNQYDNQNQDNDQTIAIETSDQIDVADGIDASEGIVPFQEKDASDASFEEIAKQSDDNLKKIIQLKSFFIASDWLQSESSLLLIDQDIAALEKLWQNDPEKIGLLQIITMNIDLLKTRDKTAAKLKKDNKTEKNFEEAPSPQVETTGVWSKIKSKFTS